MLTVSLDCTLFFIVVMTCVELFVTARPTNIPQGKNGLPMLQQEMVKLFKIVSQEKQRVSISLLIHVYVNDFLIHFKWPMQNKMHALLGH